MSLLKIVRAPFSMSVLPITLLFTQELKLDLPLSGHRLIPGYGEKMGLPVEVYLRLYAVKNEEKTLITGPSDLSRFVTRINSEETAWRFLRLFTAPETHFLFQKGTYTVELGILPPGLAGGTAMISPDLAVRVGYEAPESEAGKATLSCKSRLGSSESSRSLKPRRNPPATRGDFGRR
jgi:hypothetical protein